MDGTGGVSPAVANPWLQNALTPKSVGKSRRSWFTGTPHKVTAPEEDLPTLKLTHFTKKVMVCFDKVRLGASKTCQLSVENPFDYQQELVAEKFPYKKGFTIPEDRWEFDEMENRVLPITWTPSEAGNVRELVTFKCDGAFRLQVILLGTATEKPKGKTRRGTFLFKNSNGNVRKAPGRVRPQRSQQNGNTTAAKQPKPAQKQQRSNVGKENIPRSKDTMLKEVLNPARQTMIITKKPCSPKRSPLQERTSLSPFQSVNTSLIEITTATSPDADTHTKRDTLSLCEGMSPLLQTSFVYCGDMDTSQVPDVSQEVFNDSIEVAPLDPSQTVTKRQSSFGKPVAVTEVNVKRLSKEAQATVTKEKAPSLTPPMRRQSRRALFGNQVQIDVSHQDTNLITETQSDITQDSEAPECEDKFQTPPDSREDETIAFEVSSVTTLPSPPNEAELFPVHKSTARKILTGKRMSDPTQPDDVTHKQKCQTSPEIAQSESIAFEVPTSTSPQASKCSTNEADLFPVHESVVTKKLTSKRKSDPTKREPVSHKKLKSQLNPTKKSATVKQPVSSTTKGTQQANNKTRKSGATFEPNRGMTRTMMLRRAAAGVTTSVSKPKPAKVKRPMKGVPMAKLNLVKPNRTALPRHPMPFAAKNMFYDERWMEKQEQGFTRWLNYVLTPDDCPTDPLCKTTKIDAGALFVEANQQITVALAPSKEDLSLRAYTARRKLNRLRRSACLLFQSEPVVRVIQKVEFEVERGGLKVRTDRKIHADYGIKQKLLNMFLSYNPLWLRIGLEVVFGEILPIQGNTDILGLSRFVVQRLLWNPDIAQKYAHPTVPGLYGPGYDVTLCQFTLKKFLLLVFFLDRAKLTRLIDHDPCLFCKDAEYKSSRAMLLEFSRDYLQGEGDVTKHLSYYGYVVTHTQTALDEFDFAVSKLASDLRCGVRMARVVELLTKNWTLSRELRVPAISRLQKIHNTELALKALKERGIDVEGGGVNTRAIVDGHREKTLELLWRIIFHFQVEVMLNENQIKEEIIFLKRHLKLQRDLNDMEMTLAKTDGMLGLTRAPRGSVEPNVYFKSPRLSLLLQWCQGVCHFYGLKVENFTVSFSDGRALCYLVHHYHPSLLPLDAIRQETTQTQYQRTESPSKSDADDSFDGTWANSYSPSTGKPGEYDRLLANERHNYKMLYEKVKELGGIPMMIKSTEMSNTIPDEKVVIVYVSYLCARLLDLRTETRAARTIQLKWRAHRLRRKQKERQIQISAATKIQGAVRDFLTRRRHARILATVVKMQALMRGKLAKRQAQRLRQERLEKRQCEAAVIIQSQVKGFLEQRHFKKLKASTVVLQAAFRGHLARQHIRRQHQAAFTIQSHYQAWKLMQLERVHYLSLRSAAVTIQTIYRGHVARKEVCRARAARTLQAHWRGYLARRAFLIKTHSAITIQAWFRMYLVRKEYLEICRATLTLQQHIRAYLTCKHQRRAATMMQALVRGYLVRQHVKKMNQSAVCIQSNFRAYIKQKHYRDMKQAAQKVQVYWRATLLARQQCRSFQITRGACITIQAWLRGVLVRQHVRKMHHAATCLQSNYRSHRDYVHYQNMKKSAAVLQTYWRSTLQARQQAKEYQITRGAVITIQAWVRGFLVRQHVRKMHCAATCIQSNYRSHRDYTHYQDMKKSAAVLQTYWRSTLQARQQAKEYQITRGAVITIQAWVRGLSVRQHVRKMHHAATCIQSNYRAHCNYTRYQRVKRSAIVLQNYWRSALQTKQQAKEYQITRGAVITIQAVVRGFQVRQHVKKMTCAATCIQSNYRAHRDYTQYQNMKKSAAVLQTYWRSTLHARQQAKEYQITRGAVITIQAVVRGFLVRQHLTKQIAAAVCIQANYRAHLACKSYQQTRKATMTLQKYWKATLLAKTQATEFQVTKSACVTIQAYVRGFLIRQQVQRMHSAATCIQANYRAHQAYNKYKAVKQSAKVLQMYWRATLITKQQRREYQVTRGAAITIQASVRGHLVRQQIKKMNSAATCIQSNFRAYLNYTAYQKMTQSAKTIQVYWRATLLARKETAHYQITRGACITIQAWVRGFQTRCHVQKMHSAATCIQSSFRGYYAHTKYHDLKKAASVLQTYWKAILLGREQHRNYNELRRAAIVIQAVFRGRQARDCAHKERGARTIQATFRMHVARQAYLQQKQAAILIQAKYRAHKAQQSYRMMKSSAIVIQQFYRGLLLTRQVKSQFAHNRDCIVKIQSTYRMFVSRRAYLEKKMAAIRIQAEYRAYKACTEYKKQKQAAIVIQKYYRGVLMTRLTRSNFVSNRASVVKIQSYYRMHVQRKQYLSLKEAATVMQAYARGKAAHMKYKAMKHAAIVIQTSYRATREARKQQLDYQYTRGAIITIQALFRGRQARKRLHQIEQAVKILQIHWRATLQSKHAKQEYQHTRNACVIVQAAVRGFLLRRQVQKMHLAATCIQTNFRAHRDYCRYQKMKLAAVCLQIHWRATLQMKEQVREYHVARGACVTIQSCVRGFLARQRLRKMNSAAVCIQKNYRSHLDYRRYQVMKQSAKVLQSYWRATLIARQQTRNYEITRGAVITIQTWVRGYLIRQQIRKMNSAAICIQSNFRAYMGHKCYQQKKLAAQTIQMYWRATLVAKHQTTSYQISRGAVITIQAWVRGVQVRQNVRRMHYSATRIQSNYRAHRDYVHYQNMKKSAAVLQTYWRSTLQARQQAKEYQITRGAVITIQAWVRGFLVRQHVKKMHCAATCIQSNYRSHRDYTHYQDMKKSAVVLQTYWRSTLHARQQAKEYQITRGAVITIQAWVRGFLVRQHVKKMHCAATCIQSNYRSHRDYTHYQDMKKSAVVLQTYWRSTLQARQQAKEYQITRGAVITIQAWVRGFLVRQHVKKMHCAATCIQSNYRSHRDYTHYQDMKKSAAVLQTYWRSTLHARQQTKEYQITRGAVITIQAVVRGFQVRQHVKKMNCAATCIQSNYRAHKDYTHYQNMKKSAAVLQTYWRSTMLAKLQAKEYQYTRGAVITIQAWVRGFQVRHHVKKMNCAATCIQSNYRAHRDYVRYRMMKKAAIVLQTYWRSVLKARQQIKEYQYTRGAVITIQAVVRGFLIRQQLKKQNAAAVCIQANFRAHLACQSYQQTRKATVVLQKRWKATLLAKKQTGEYQVIRRSCITIQAYVRGFQLRQQVKKMNSAATCIQANYRAHQACKEYQRMKQSAKVLQMYWRATLTTKQQRREYQVTRGAAITIQASLRGHRVRQQIKKMNAAATCIQSNFRACRDLTAYQKMRQSAKTIQVYWGATLLARNQMINYQITRGACITIQAWVRGFLTRLQVQKMHSAATCIQSNFRGYQTRKGYHNLLQATSVLQTRWRAVLLGREQQNSYTKRRQAAIVIQAVFRGRQARRCAHQERSARTIQAAFRMYTARQAYRKQKQAAIVIQAKYRAHEAQKSYQRIKSSAIIIQQYYRGLLKTRQVHSQYVNTKDSIVKIQSTFRMFVERQSYLKKKSAAVRIQAEYRAYKAQKQYKRQRKAAIVIQRYYRSVLLTRQTKSNFESTRESILKIQSYYRMHMQRKQYLNLKQTATVMQAYARGKAAHTKYKAMKHAAVIIQTRYRATLETRQQQLNYQYTRDAIITIQALFRGRQARKLACQVRAAVTIQALYRGFVQKRQYQLLRKSVVLLQAVVRGNQARARFAEKQRQWNAAVCIQKAFRGFTARREAEALRKVRLAQVHRFAAAAYHHLCAIRLQRTYRNYRIMELAKQRLNSIVYIQQWWRARLERLHYTKLQRGTILLQRAVRRHQAVRNAAAIKLQSYARVWLAKQYVCKIKASALKIQCMWRGYKVRTTNKSKKVAAARAKCLAANAAATEEKKLCNRTTSALDYLLQYKNLSYILEALINLDVVTRLSPICCERLVEGQAVPVLYTLIRSCNRSQPCKEVIKYCVSILLNLVKYPKTTQAVFDVPDSVATILDLLQIYREKGTLIFCQTCLLLGTLSQDPERAEAIHAMPKITEKIKSIHRLTERKHKMDGKRIDAKRRSLNASRLNSTFLNSSRLNSSMIPGTNLKRRRVQPDWVLGRDRMREIQDPMHASTFLMDALRLLQK